MNKMAKITVECDAPKYAKGKYAFKSFVEFYEWLCTIKRVSRHDLCVFIFNVAKDGRARGGKYGLGLAVSSDRCDYALANEIASNVDLFDSSGKCRDKHKVRIFAEKFDERIK